MNGKLLFKSRSFSDLRKRVTRRKRTPPGASPGLITVSEDAPKPKVTIYSYNETVFEEKEIPSLQDLKNWLEQNKHLTHWIDVKGLGDKDFMEGLTEYFKIHRLEMEDVLNTYQRPKLEEHKYHIFIVSRMLYHNKEDEMMNDQVSLFLGENYVMTLQERYEDFFDIVRQRLRQSRGNIRKSKADYMAYAILDSIVDHYYPFLEKSGERLDALEDELFARSTRQVLQKIQMIKRELIVFRRTIFAERDKVNDMLRSPSDLISAESKIYLRDTYDHTIQAMDMVESYKEITASMMDIYLSNASNRMNEIIKVLAIISTVFIPLTFIVGIYGMNFSPVDKHGNPLQWNMPELYSPYGYAGIMIFMLLVVIFQLYIFYRKGWLSK